MRGLTTLEREALYEDSRVEDEVYLKLLLDPRGRLALLCYSTMEIK